MARKVDHVTIEAVGRDQGKVFVLTEMPAVQAERWATQALYLLASSGLSLPAGSADSGMSGLAGAPLAGLPALRALQDPSLDAWWDCVQYQHLPNQMPRKISPGALCEIDEIATVNHLRMKVLEMHVGFFSPANPSTTGSSSQTTTTRSSVTPTSPARPAP